MREYFTCSDAPVGSPADVARRPRRPPGGLVVDIHCHVLTPSAAEMMRPHATPENEPAIKFSSPESREINRAMHAKAIDRLTVAEARLVDMDRLGIDVQAISPAPQQYYYWAEPELGRSAARLVNDRLAEIVSRHRDRFVALGTVPLQAPAMAVAELRRCVRALGMRGVEICSNVNGRELSDPAFAPFFAAAEELGILIFIHPMSFTHGDRLRDHYFSNTIGNPLDSTLAIAHLIFGGVLDRHPGIKICVAHGGGYAPMYSGRFDHAFHARADCRAHIGHPPSHYLRRLYFDTVVFDPAQIGHLVAKYGADHVVMGTDYPYDMAEPDPVALVASVADLGDDDRAKILGGNAARLLGLHAMEPRRS